tara:strand:- start:655 stop:1551 length:897 start_codon:yes stop_codon:yes gene_type:complete
MINLKKIKKEKSVEELLEFGILNIDKPSGPTSFRVDEIIKRKLGLRKTSHFGTLDPRVTGVLPIATNRACKLLRWFMIKNKTYVGIMKLHSEISKEKLNEEMKKFIGKIIQKPPVKSRVKRQDRQREVFSWKILEYDKKKKEVLFETEVEAGTYIRKLIHDLGLKIGGAHMSELRRTKAGIFSEDNNNFVNLYELDKLLPLQKVTKDSELKLTEENEKKLKDIIIPGEIISEILPVIQVKEESVSKLLTGKPIFKEDLKKEIEQKEGDVAVFSSNKFIEIAKIVQNKSIIAKPEFVKN